jgi:hypothetical protein
MDVVRHIRPEGSQTKVLPPAFKMAPAEGERHQPLAMAASRLELNLVRLLCRCEAMAAEKRDPEEWRLEKVRGFHDAVDSLTPGEWPVESMASPVPTAT